MLEEIDQLQDIYKTAELFLVQYSFQILGALIILLVGFLIAKKAGRGVEVLMTKKNIDVTLSRFVGNSAHTILLGLVILIVLGKLGVSVTPLVAVIGALSLGAGLALQGMLSNYAAGFTIIVTRPFVVGDTISVQGQTGVVDSVHLPYTILVNEDAVRIQIPNRLVVGEILQNSKDEKLIELSVGVAYGSDPHQVIRLIGEALKNIEGINSAHGLLIGIQKYADSSIEIGVRFRAPTKKYFDTLYSANLAIYDCFKQNHIQIPFPQREVRLLKDAD